MNNALFNNKQITQHRIMNEKTHSNQGFNSNKEIISSLWKSFAKIRINKGFRQEDIVEMTGVSISTIRRFEAWTTISLDSFLRIMKSVWHITDIDAIFDTRNKNNHFDYSRVRA